MVRAPARARRHGGRRHAAGQLTLYSGPTIVSLLAPWVVGRCPLSVVRCPFPALRLPQRTTRNEQRTRPRTSARPAYTKARVRSNAAAQPRRAVAASGCDPVFDIEGAFFPSWMISLLAGVLLDRRAASRLPAQRAGTAPGTAAVDLHLSGAAADDDDVGAVLPRLTHMSNVRETLALRLLGRLLGVAIVVATVVLGGYVYAALYRHPRTDDAYVRANTIGIAPHVGGPIVELPIVDNQRVRQGDLLFVVDPRPYESVLAQAARAARADQSGDQGVRAGDRRGRGDARAARRRRRLRRAISAARRAAARRPVRHPGPGVRGAHQDDGRARRGRAGALRPAAGARSARSARRRQRPPPGGRRRGLRRRAQRRYCSVRAPFDALRHQPEHRRRSVRQPRARRSSRWSTTASGT